MPAHAILSRYRGASRNTRALLVPALVVVACLSAGPMHAAPGDTLFQDRLNSNLNNWTVSSGGGDAGIGNETSSQGRSMRLRWGPVAVESDPFNAAVPGAEFSVWIRRGDDSFSEDPDNGEDLYVQYLNDSGAWSTLEIMPGGGVDGEILNRTYTLPSDALHAALQLRFVLINGSGVDWDYWHIDEVNVVETEPVVSACEDFESGLNWTVNASGGDAGISSATFNSPGNSMYLRWDTVTVTSPVTDYSGATALSISAWVRRGDDSFSEDPDNNEDLVFEYRNSSNNWIELETFDGNGGSGQIFTPVYTLGADAWHANFQLRFRFLQGNGVDWDYWHVDDICALTPLPTTDHLAIGHDTTAVNCQIEPVTITAHASDHSVDTGYTGTLVLGTSTGNGDWTLLGGSGVLNNGAADDGVATYTMVSADNGVVQLGLKNTHVETVSINVTDGTISENTGTAPGSEDQNLDFAESGFVFLGGGVAGNIGTQIAGKSSATAPGAQVIELQAIRTNNSTGACESALQGVNAIDMAFECVNPSSCGAAPVNVNGGTPTNIPGNPLGSVGSYTPVSLDFGNATDSTASFVTTYPDAGEIRLHARYNIPLPNGNPSGNFMIGGSNAYVVRPFGFDIDFSGDRASNGTSGVSYAADANGSAFRVAGADFDATLTAVAWSGADDADNDGVPDACADLTDNAVTGRFGVETAPVTPADVALTHTLTAPGGGAAGTLINSANGASFASGAGSKTIRWSEVGIIDLNASLTDYLGSGQNVQGNVCNVGRFYPQEFAIANTSVTNRSDIVACADPFTYMDESFTIDFDLEAYNAATPAVITQNYEGAFAKLDTTVLGDMNYGATDSATDLTARLSVSSAGAFAGGVAPVTATLSLDRDPTPDGAYTAFEVGIAPADSDGAGLAALDLSLDGGPDTHGLLGQTDIRYGRLNLANNFGSELLPLTMSLTAEYYTDATTGFVLNTDDDCTAITTADVLLYNDQEPKQGRVLGNTTINVSGAASTTLTGVSAFTGGLSALSFTAPGAEGYVDVEVQTPAWLLSDLDGIDHGILGPGMHCVPGLAATDPAHIPSCAADANTIDDVPTARGNFGIFRGSDNIIYIREMY